MQELELKNINSNTKVFNDVKESDDNTDLTPAGESSDP